MEAGTCQDKRGVIVCRCLHPGNFILVGHEMPFLEQQTKITRIALEHY